MKYWPRALPWLAGLLSALGSLLLSVGRSAWYDEAYTILIIRSGWRELFSLTSVDVHPPLYYVLLKVWGAPFGYAEPALRAFSMIAMGVAVALVLVLVRRLFGDRALLFAAPAVVLGPFVLRYGYEIRMYALCTLIGVVATLFLVRAVAGDDAGRRGRKRWWVLYAVAVAAGMYTMYMMAAVWLAHVAWLVSLSLRGLWRPGGHMVRAWHWLGAYVVAVVLFAPYLPTALAQLQHSALPGMGEQVTPEVAADSATVLFLFTPGWKMNGWTTLLLAAAACVVAVLAVRAWQGSRGARSELALLICLAVVPLVFFAVTSLPPREPIYINRYLAHVAIWIYLLIGVVVALGTAKPVAAKTVAGKPATASPAMGVLAGALCLAVAAVGLVNLERRGNFVFEQNKLPQGRQLRAAADCGPGTVVVTAGPQRYIDALTDFEDCDYRFLAAQDTPYFGGFAVLHGSDKRVASVREIAAPRVVLIHGDDKLTLPGERYRHSDGALVGTSRVDTYVRD